MNSAFEGCSNLTIADDAGIPDLSNVTSMFRMFINSSFSGDLSKWDVSKVTNMGLIFSGSDFNGDLSEWDVSKVMNMSGMFASSPFNQDLSKWDISSVNNMFGMFNDNTSMSSENYDKLLIGWSTLNEEAGETKIPSSHITLNAPDHYTCKGEAARNKLINTHSWTIEGDSKLDDAIDPTPDVVTLKALTACAQITENELKAAAPSATDNCPGASVTVIHDVTNFPITSNITITWTFTDEAGNTAAQTQTVTIGDTEAPEVTGTLPEVTAQCPIGAENELTEPAAPADNCGGTVTVALKTGTPFPIQAGTTTITWIYTDESGNTSEQTQDVTIDDTMPPAVTGNLNAITAQCPINAETDLTKPAAPTDNCGGTVKVAVKDDTNFPIQAGTTTITWIYTDENGNTSEQTQTVTIADTEAPTIADLNAITAECSLEENDFTIPKANDVCDGEITATHNVTNFPITSNTTITWTYTDKAGNIATQTQAVTITECPPEESKPLSTGDDALEAVVFPNPSSGRYVEVQSSVESPIRILSVGGELLLESTTNTKIDAASLQSGLYLVQLPDGRLLKFVKQ
ncbi:MAG: BspA family leucine-rich repeat surface protein [Ekhidna sp.]|nr:BspA family leucine-rich repeat surface protein [Ekhidna sp.]